MSTWVSKNPGVPARHRIDVPERAADLVRRTHALIEHAVAWPHLWHSGDRVEVTLADGGTYPGAVLSVSDATQKVLIELL